MNAFTPVPPNSIGAEQSLLGAILVNGDLFARVTEHVSADDFSEDLHCRIFSIMAELIESGMRPSPATVRPHLGDHQLVEGMTTGKYLASLCASTGAGGNLAMDYAKQIHQMADYRRLGEIGEAMKSKSAALGGGISPARVAAEMVSLLDPIISAGRSATIRRVTIGEAARNATTLAFDRMNGVPTKSISTGLAELDAMIGGLERGEMSLLAGRPSMGKTAAGLEMAFNVAKRGTGVLYFSLEMGDGQLANRVLSSMLYDATPAGMAPLYYSSIARGNMTDREAERLENATRALAIVPLIIEPESGVNMAQIAARVRRVKEKLAADGVDLGLVVIDHIGLIQPSSHPADMLAIERMRSWKLAVACARSAKRPMLMSWRSAN